jgi:hypothetical protein
MARILIVLMALILSFMLLTSCEKIERAVGGKGESRVSWNDPAGDATEKTFIAPRKAYKTKLPAVDVITATATGKDGHIVITTRIAGTFPEFFDFTDPGGRKHGGLLAEYFIDVDNNLETGATPSEHKKSGYDVGIRIMLGYITEKTKVAGSGNVKTNEIISNYATFAPKAMNKSLSTLSWIKTDERTTLGEDIVKIRIPYGWFGLKSGDTVRICYKEGYQRTGLGYSGDKLLKLK